MTVLCAMDGEGQQLFRHLQRTRARVKHIWPVPEAIGENSDIVLCEYQRGIGRKLSWVPGEAKAALILLLPQTGQYDLQEIRAAIPDALLHRPYLPHAIDAALLIALDHFTFSKRQRIRIARLDESIKYLREIERAKHVIMTRQAVGEQEAYRLLRDMAMERRVTVAELAAKVVDS